MVQRIENTPQALSLSEFTTTSAMAASAIVITKMMAKAVAVAVTRAHLLAGDVGERAAAAAHRGDEDDEVVHAAGEHGAEQQPEEAGQVAELRGEHRPDERARAGDGGEVVAEEHQRVHGHVVVPVALRVGGGGAQVVERGDLRGEERAVEAVAEEQHERGADDQVQRGHGTSGRRSGDRWRATLRARPARPTGESSPAFGRRSSGAARRSAFTGGVPRRRGPRTPAPVVTPGGAC